MILLLYCWIWFVNILLRIFAYMLKGKLVYNFLFILVWFWYQDAVSLVKWAWKQFLLKFLEEFERTGIKYFGRIYQWSSLLLDFVWSFLITDSISLLLTGILMFFISSWLSLERLYVCRNSSISSRLSNLLTQIVVHSSLIILCISAVLILFFISNFIYLNPISVFPSKFS